MTEYEIVYLTSEYLNRTWQVLQFWASVSFGLIAVSHLAAKHLNLVMVLVLTMLYCAFSVFAISILALHGEVVDGFLKDLVLMDAGAGLASEGARNVVATAPGPARMAAIISTFLGTFAGVIYFLWSSYFKARRRSVG